jgi:hypothetical protein
MREPRHDEPSATTADLARSQRETQADVRREPSGSDAQATKHLHEIGEGGTVGRDTEQRSAPLFAPDQADQFRARWDRIQTGFVDEPHPSVEQADALVAEVIKRLTEVFAKERETLEEQWRRGENLSTEDLRVALQRYRSFFTRLLSV